jgi:aspartate aminotransferase-like enzyme
MDLSAVPDNPYLLLTPGPLSTTKSVRAAMLRDRCTLDPDYHRFVQKIHRDLVSLATSREGHTTVLMQGSGPFAVESVIGTAIPEKGRLLLLSNGAYGKSMVEIAKLLPHSYQSPIITSFLDPPNKGYDFETFYTELESRGFVIYPGKASSASRFRIGNIGDVGQEQIRRLMQTVSDSMHWR